MTENRYKEIFDDYLEGTLNVDAFIDKFMNQWREDRDNNIQNDDRFQRLVDRVFTSCDCYTKQPVRSVDINEEQLKSEVALFRYIWFG